jgi:hypothetical protein
MDLGVERPVTSSTAGPASGSKRKRETQDDIAHDYRNNHQHNNTAFDLGRDDGDTPTPNKRSRSQADHSDIGSGDEATPAHLRNLRRKRGSRNLSNLNLRHAASLARLPQPQISPRESKFQEGSLTDKPSAKPPSVFTRFTRTDSGNLQYVDELMADYHGEAPTPTPAVVPSSADLTVVDQNIHDEEIPTASQKEDEPGMVRFGKTWTSNFHPVALWNRLWNDTKDELTRQNMLEAERKAKVKAEAEAKYAQMKMAGQLDPQPVSVAARHSYVSTPRDSAVVLESGGVQHRRVTSYGSSHQRDSQDSSHRDGSEVPEPPRTLRGRLSRLHLRKPSLASLAGSVKRAKSDFNLAASNREESSSVSPVKAEFDVPSSILKRSVSKYDLKKQHKLSRRVSDLEAKLQKARQELDTALAEASPIPKLGSKYERWTPVNSMKRNRFVPGTLPTLPSERLLFPEWKDAQDTSDEGTIRAHEPRSRKGIDLNTAFERLNDYATAENSSRDDTRVSRPRSSGQDGHGEPAPPSIEFTGVDMEDSNDTADATNRGKSESMKQQSNDALDAKLKALDAYVKANMKPPKFKKQHLAPDDGLFRPDHDDDDDDAEWEEAEQISVKKKRRSVNKKPQTKKSAHEKLPKRSSSLINNNQVSEDDSVFERDGSQILRDVEMGDALGSEDELACTKTIDGEELPLEPLIEEEEEHGADSPSNESAKTPTRIVYGRNSLRSRSSSPQKRFQLGVEEKMRAVSGAYQSRPSFSLSPPPGTGHSKRVDSMHDAMIIVPGENGVPNLPQAIRRSIVETTGLYPSKSPYAKTSPDKENFEWPDDVF